jgi:DNA polymerase
MIYRMRMQSDQTLPSSGYDEAAALFEWYGAMGVDITLGDAPFDRFEESAKLAERQAARQAAPAEAQGGRALPVTEYLPQSAAAPARPMVQSQTAQLPTEGTVMEAREAAQSAKTLDELKTLISNFNGCNLKLTAKNTVFGDGNPEARLMLVGEAPGRDEDIEGRPFVGRSGQLLDRMLAAIGYGRSHNAYIANVIYWRPPGNRDPSDLEVAICRPFILRQIELIDPTLLVFLGAQPAKALLGGEAVKQGINKLRGHWCELEVGGKRIKALPTFHPAYLLRTPIKKREAWRDLLTARLFLENGGMLPPT